MSESKQKSILIIEDEQVLSKVLNEHLSEVGYLTFQEYDGEKGLETALEKKPDLILLDLMMPVKDGITMLKELREDTWGKNAKVMIMTNLTKDDKFEDAMKYGVFDYLVKANWDISTIVDKINNAFENNAQV